MIKREDFKIIFMGTPEFAVESLDVLVRAGYPVAAVITAPDKPAGRGKKLTPSEVKKYALNKGLRILQPERLKDEAFLKILRDIKPHLGVVVAFRMLPLQVWALPEKGTVNLHASLLPQYRGAAPIQHAIINGEKETGLTTFFLDEQIDTGKIIFQKKLTVGKDEYLDSLYERMKTAGAELLLETVDAIRENRVKEIPQETLVSPDTVLKPAPKIFKADCRIDRSKPLVEIYNKIRGLSPFPGPFGYLKSPDGEKLQIKIFRAHPEEAVHSLDPGSIVTDGRKFLKIAVPGGFLVIEELQAAGRKRMHIADFLRGTNVDERWRFE